MNKVKRILLCPLNWGLGHGTRDIPIIEKLLGNGYEVLIASGGRTLALLMKEFPELQFIVFPDYNVRYFPLIPAFLSVIFQFPLIMYRIVKEHFVLKKIIEQYRIDAIVSDNRYGLFSQKVPSVFISHQILIKPPPIFSFMEIWTWLFSSYFAQKFTYTWIPDVPSHPNLSGDLSHKYPLPENGQFVGTLAAVNEHAEPIPCDIFIMISGPEPARTRLEKRVLEQLDELEDLTVIIILGKPESEHRIENLTQYKKHIIYTHLDRIEISRYMLGAELIISRPGYTTVMEIAQMRKRAAWIPTPGQTEQEYLSEHFTQMNYFTSIDQRHLNLIELWLNRGKINILQLQKQEPLLDLAVKKLNECIR